MLSPEATQGVDAKGEYGLGLGGCFLRLATNAGFEGDTGRGITPLQAAARAGDVDLLGTLLQMGADKARASRQAFEARPLSRYVKKYRRCSVKKKKKKKWEEERGSKESQFFGAMPDAGSANDIVARGGGRVESSLSFASVKFRLFLRARMNACVHTLAPSPSAAHFGEFLAPCWQRS